MPIRVLFLAVLVAVAGCGKREASSSDPIKVAAASDLAFAFREVGAAFEKKTGKKVTFTFGSTGQLAKQISEGAPYDVFAAANVSFVDEVVKEQACDGATKAMYARGRIVVWTKRGGAPVTALTDLTDARFVKIAIANPEHAPYGKAAKQAFETAGIWDTVKPKIVYGENVSQTLQFAQTGNVEAAIAALSLAKASDDGEYMVIDENLHKPIDQALVVCKRGVNQAVAKEFAAFVNSDEGRAIMKRFGFLLPGESA
ncbi:MAG: molybdate ABC transporter substrate-binding protein [Myxococcota bacterium]|nr:molybdate ABC transporter substrate-binding protein [Myxococcota bacterium]